MAETDPVATSSIAVHRGDWTNLAPEFARLVAPPVSVSAMPVVTDVEAALPLDGVPDHPAGLLVLERQVGPWRQGQLARSRGNMPVGRHRQAAR